MASVIAFCALAMAPGAAQRSERTPEELQRALQRRYDLVQDFSADFTQTYEGGVLSTTVVERGVVRISKPGRMRWDYHEPERKVVVSDGEQIFLYLPEDRQGRVGRLPALSQATTPALFLAGAGNLVDDFSAAFDTVEDQPPNSYALRLTPVRSEPDFEFLTLVLDGRSLAILRLIAHDLQGGISAFAFSDLKENQGVSDTQFTFEFPPGTDVIDNTLPQ